MGRWFTILFALFPLLVYTECSTMLSPPFSSSQIKFWSENVQNKMPTSIFKKLSPLTWPDIDSKMSYPADSRFCALAKLSCNSNLDHVKESFKIYYRNPQASILSARQKNGDDDPFSFFRISILKNGNLVHLPTDLQEWLPDRAFLPPQIASKISLNNEEIFRLFPGSSINEATKESIENNLFYCNAAAIEGEVKSCPKSLEEMIDFSKSALGGKKLISITSKSLQGSNTQLTIKNIKKFKADKIVACHEVFLPFAAYFCHSISSTSLYSVDFVDPKTGVLVNTLVAACHMNTSVWPKNHVAFKILKFSPGQGEVCHWFTQIDLAWILDNEST